jgi:hypothetical protein
MSGHLSSEQISKWIAGDLTPDAERHLKGCAYCTAETARMKALLTNFRSSVIEWSALQKEAKAPEHWTQPQEQRRLIGGMMRWSMAAAALAIVLIVLICKNFNDRNREAEAFKADLQLWEEVNAHVSRPVPAPMEPLMNLIAWEPETTEK